MKTLRLLFLMLSAMLLSATAVAAMDEYHVKDTIPGSGYTVTGLYDQISGAFGYDTPDGGVTVLIFYAGDCGKSSQGLRTFANSRWINREDVYIRAVESRGCPLSTIKHQMQENAGSNASRLHPVLGSNQLLFDYVHKVKPNQRSITYPFVVLIKNEGGIPYIRYASEDVQTEAFYSEAINALLQEDQDHYVTQNGLVYRLDDYTATIVDHSGTLPAYLSIPVHVNGKSVTAIDQDAFRGCEELEYVDIFPTTSTIGAYAFADCPNLYRVNLGGQQILEGAFSNCPNLQVLQMDDISYIGKNAFKDCSELMAIVSWPQQINSLSIISESAFSGCQKLNLTIPDCVLYIGDNAFQNSGITSATLPSGLWKLGSGVFQDCTSLTKANIKASLSALPEKTFAGCTNLQSVTLPESLTEIGVEAFDECSSLSAISLPNGITTLRRNAFSGAGLTSAALPDSVTTLETGIFLDCTSLASVTLPEHLTELPMSLFAGCSSLASVALPEELTAIPENLFSQCKALTSVHIPERVTSIGDAAFYLCTNLETIRLPEGLTTLGEYAFSDCSSLASVLIPAKVDSIGAHCFDGCDYMQGIYFQGDAPTEVGRQVIDPYQYGISLYYLPSTRGWVERDAYDSEAKTWNGCPIAPWNSVVSGTCGAKGSEASVTWSLDVNTGAFTVSGTGAMGDIPYNSRYRDRYFVSAWSNYKAFICTVTVEEGVTYVGNGAFFNMPYLTSVTLPDGISGLGFRIFEGCAALSTVCFLGDAPRDVETNNFSGCADDFSICYPDGAAGWTSPTWNEWPAAHTLLRGDILIHNSARAASGNQAVLAVYDDDGRFLGCSSAFWGNSPLLSLSLPRTAQAETLRLFSLDEAAPFHTAHNLTGLLSQAAQ